MMAKNDSAGAFDSASSASCFAIIGAEWGSAVVELRTPWARLIPVKVAPAAALPLPVDLIGCLSVTFRALFVPIFGVWIAHGLAS